MKSKRGCAIGAALLVGAAVLLVSFFFSVEASPYHYAQSDLLAMETFPYDDWEAVLGEFVDADGRVDYQGLQADREELDRFVALIAAVGPNSRPDLFRSEAQHLSYYLNAYNALVLFDVLVHWPLESPMDVRLQFFYSTRFILDGRKANLYELENYLIREEFKDPRVHFVMNSASQGCPKLINEPLLPETLEEQLSAATAFFLGETRNVEVFGEALYLSEIFEIYPEDFPPDPVTWIRSQLPLPDSVSQEPPLYLPWDWTINSR